MGWLIPRSPPPPLLPEMGEQDSQHSYRLLGTIILFLCTYTPTCSIALKIIQDHADWSPGY